MLLSAERRGRVVVLDKGVADKVEAGSGAAGAARVSLVTYGLLSLPEGEDWTLRVDKDEMDTGIATARALVASVFVDVGQGTAAPGAIMGKKEAEPTAAKREERKERRDRLRGLVVHKQASPPN